MTIRTENLARELRRAADILTALDEAEPLPRLYVTVNSYDERIGSGYGLTARAQVQVSAPCTWMGDVDTDEQVAQRLAVVDRLTNAGLDAFTPIHEPEKVTS